jgi:hypothetical protein
MKEKFLLLFLLFSTSCGCSPILFARNLLLPITLPLIKTTATLNPHETIGSNMITPTLTDTQSIQSNILTDTIGNILSNSSQYIGSIVEIIGYYRGWDLLGETHSEPPLSRNDWVITDSSGSIYVVGLSPYGLNPSSIADTRTILRLEAIVQRSKEWKVYLYAKKVEILSR